MPEIPERVYSRSFPTKAELLHLRDECIACQVSAETRELMDRLSGYPPDIRLMVNLKHLLGMMAYTEVTNILSEGLTSDERKALIELDLSGMSTAARETAHGVLNVHERWVLLKRLSDFVRKAKAANEEHLEERKISLNDILGE